MLYRNYRINTVPWAIALPMETAAVCVFYAVLHWPRVSITQKAGKVDIMGQRKDGAFGAFSGAGKLIKELFQRKYKGSLMKRA